MESLVENVAQGGAQIPDDRRRSSRVLGRVRRTQTFRQCAAGRLSGALAIALVEIGCSGQSETPSNQLEPGQALDVSGMHGHASGSVRLDGSSIVEGRNAFLVDFSPSDTTLTQASALMPAHGHGSPAPPTITRTQAGYRVADMILSMPGLWDVLLDVDVAGATDRIEFTVDVP